MTADPKLVAAAAHAHLAPDMDGYHDSLVQQTETARHLFSGGFDGVVPVSQAFEHAWLGLGVASGLDGEIAVVDGVVWQIPDTGIPHVADPSLKVPFAASERRAPAEAITAVDIPTSTTFDQLAGLVAAAEPGCVTLRLEGTFSDVTLRSEHKQTPPYRPVDEVLDPESDQEVRFHFPTWQGVMVGYRFPDAKDGMLLPGLHLHAISADQKSGGHVKDMICESVNLTWAPAEVQVTIPVERV